MVVTDTPYDGHRRSSYAGLGGLILGLTLGAATLYAVAGLPHLPAQAPTWSAVGSTMRGTSLPLGPLAYALAMAAWAVWLWIVISVLLRLLVSGIDVIAHGAAWVGTLRAISDRFTLPIVRRAVDGALIAAFVVNVASRTMPSAAAASPPLTSTPHVAAVRSHARSTVSSSNRQDHKRPDRVEYTVQAGDTLWGIAEQFYGTGYEFPRLVAANAGRQMADGERFTQAGVIQPGWRLEIPLPSDRVHEAAGGSYYVVEEGDTLRGIAARLLGNQDRWATLFDLNRGKARLNGHVLTDPDLIWPGLHLRIAHPAGGHGGPELPPRPRPPRERHKKHGSEATPTPVKPTPTPPPASPTPRPTTAAPTPAVRPAHHTSDDTALVEAVAGAAAAVAAGGALLFARRRVRRRLSEPPIPAPRRQKPIDDFADAEPDRVLGHELYSGEVESIVLIGEQARRFLSERRLVDIPIIYAHRRRNVSTLVLAAGFDVQEGLIEIAGELGKFLGGKGHAFQTPDRDIALQLSGPSLTGLISSQRQRKPTGVPLLPLGVLPEGPTLFVNWDELGHVLVAGLPGGGTEVTLTSVLGTLAARRRPEELCVWTVADHRHLPSQLSRLPHQHCGFIDAADAEGVQEILSHLRTELVARMRRATAGASRRWIPSKPEPELILVVAELTELMDEGSTVEILGSHGPDFGVRIIAASERVDALSTECLDHFKTRLILQTLDDDESIRLLGQPDGSDLGSGELYLRLASRAPMRLRGFRISTDHLDRLVQLMRNEYGGRYPMPSSTMERPCSTDAVDRIVPGTDGTPLTDEGFSRDDDVGRSSQLPAKISLRAGEVDIAPTDGDGSESALVQSTSPEQAVDDEQLAEETETLAGVPTEPNHNQTVPAEADLARRHFSVVDRTGLADSVSLEGTDLLNEVAGESVGSCSLIEVRCFGDFVVTNGDREISPSGEEGASYKAWELLAFLAVQPGGVVSRDKLLAAVWADVDMDRAATRMRTAMKRLRALLARQVPNLSRDIVRADRDGMCRLDATAVSSDVHAFSSAIRGASRLPPDEAGIPLETARALYRGDLLSGRGARFYEWVEERGDDGVSLREHYREQYYRATHRLARIYVQQGQAEQAVPLYKSLLKSEPTLEDVVRELFRCYQQLGDLSSLIREDRHLRQALQDAYYNVDDPEDDPGQYQPEPETVSLFNVIRDKLGAASDTSQGDQTTSVR